MRPVAALAQVSMLLVCAATLRGEQPLGLLLNNSDGEIQRPGRESPLLARTGAEIFAGDVIRSGKVPLPLSYCPSKQLLTLAPGQTFRVEPGAMGLANLRIFQASQPVGVCELPPMSPLVEAVTTPRRAPRLSANSATRVADIDRALAVERNTPRLLLRVARAVRLEKAGWQEEAIHEYDTIRHDWPDAEWAEEVSGQIANDADRTRGFKVDTTPNLLPVKTYAVLIGISEYGSKTRIPWLRYAAKDADLFAEYLGSDRGGNLRVCTDDLRDNCEIVLLKNKNATLSRVSDVFRPGSFVAQHASPENALVIFVAAHGLGPSAQNDWKDDRIANRADRILNPEPVILTYDADDNDLKSTSLPMAQIRVQAAIAAQSYGRVLVYVDVCRAGYVGAVQENHAVESAARDTFELSKRTGIFMASDRTNNAFEFEELGGHGAFTYFAIAGLSRTTPTIGSLPFGALGTDISQNVQAVTRYKQFPDEFAYDKSMPVVDDLSKTAISVPSARLSPSALPPRGPRGEMLSAAKQVPVSGGEGGSDPFQAGRLRSDQPNSAWAEWRRLNSEGRSSAAAYGNRLRMALEDRGQMVILKYLRGDQDPMQESEFLEGARDFEAALEIAPAAPFNESRALFCRGRALVFRSDAEDFDRAVELLQRSIELDGKRGYAYNALGIAYLEHAGSDATRLELAEKAFHDSITYAPYWPYPWHNLALVLIERGNYATAIECYRHAMKLAPQYPYLPYNLGLLYQRINRLKDARALYQHASDVAAQSRKDLVLHRNDGRKPEESEAWNALGTLIEKRNAKKAEEFYEKAIAADREVLSARYNLAALIVRRDPSSARPEQLWIEVLKKKPDHEPSLLAYARYLVQHGRLDEANTQYRLLIKLAREFGPAHRELAAVLVSLDRPEDALREFQLSQSVLSSDSAILETLGDRLRTRDQKMQAREAYVLAEQALGTPSNHKSRTRLDGKMTDLQ